MVNQLDSLKSLTTVVADTGDIEAIKKYTPIDATTNPSLLLKAAALPQYAGLIDKAVIQAKNMTDAKDQQKVEACDLLATFIGKEIIKVIPGRVSTEVDARLSFDKDATIEKAQKLINLYSQAGIDKSRILIKIASTWEGIKAAEILEKQGINCNLTLLFSFVQARACAEAGVHLISPFVGRILDWYKAKNPDEDYSGDKDPGVLSVSKIYDYYKANGYKTIVMGASFRNTGEILSLAGCDYLTISPQLLESLEETPGSIQPALIDKGISAKPATRLLEAEFRWGLNQDPMATEKLAEGIRNFAADQAKLETLIEDKL